MDKHSVNFLPSATLGKHDSVNNDSVKLVYRVSTNGALGEYILPSATPALGKQLRRDGRQSPSSPLTASFTECYT